MYKRRNGRLSREQMSLCYSDAVVVSFSCVFFFIFYLKFKSTHVHTDLQNRNARVRMTVQKNKTKISRYLHHVQTTNTTQILSRYCFFFFSPRLSFLLLIYSNKTIPETVKRRRLVSTGTTGREHERKLKP